MADTSVKSALRSTWESAAPGWAKWEHVFTTGFAGATDALIDMAGIGPGMRVLDVACGAGSQTIAAARRVGPDGTVVASDIAATMLAHVRENAAREGLRNIETLECAADDLDEAQAPFDAAMSRMGLMLFPSPARAAAAVRAVLKPGARFAALVFTTPASNPLLARPMAILLRHAGKSPPARGQPGLFALGANGILEGLMKDSGFVDVATKVLRPRLALPGVSDALRLLQEGAGAYRAVVADLGDDAKARAWDEVRECLTQFEGDGGFAAELEVVIASGARPA